MAAPAPAVATAAMSPAKTRQYAHLHAQLGQLNAHIADLENLMRMTSAQAGDMRFLGGYVGAMFMGAARVLGEEGVRGAGAGVGNGSGNSERSAAATGTKNEKGMNVEGDEEDLEQKD